MESYLRNQLYQHRLIFITSVRTGPTAQEKATFALKVLTGASFLLKYLSKYFFFLPVAADPVDEDPEVDAVLGHHAGAHGAELRLRDAHDRAAHLHAAGAALLH